MIVWGPIVHGDRILGPFVQGDRKSGNQIGWGPFVQGDQLFGDCLSRGTELVGVNFFGTGSPGHCVEIGFTWTFPGNQDATVKLKYELISIKFY